MGVVLDEVVVNHARRLHSDRQFTFRTIRRRRWWL